MRIVALKTLRAHWALPGRGDSEEPLKAWYTLTSTADWPGPSAVKTQFRAASFVGDRVVFNIGGNKYRLVVFINYPFRRVYVRFVGTHAEYDRIDVERV